MVGHLLIITNQNYKSISKMVSNCWVSGQGGHNLFQLFKKVKKKQYQELNELSDNFSFEYVPTKQENKEVKLRMNINLCGQNLIHQLINTIKVFKIKRCFRR